MWFPALICASRFQRVPCHAAKREVQTRVEGIGIPANPRSAAVSAVCLHRSDAVKKLSRIVLWWKKRGGMSVPRLRADWRSGPDGWCKPRLVTVPTRPPPCLGIWMNGTRTDAMGSLAIQLVSVRQKKHKMAPLTEPWSPMTALLLLLLLRLSPTLAFPWLPVVMVPAMARHKKPWKMAPWSLMLTVG